MCQPFGKQCSQPLRVTRPTQLQCRASIVSKSTLPEEFQENKGYKLQFVVFSRLAPEQTTDTLREHLPEHEAYLKGLGDRLAFHGPFLNAEVRWPGGTGSIFANKQEYA